MRRRHETIQKRAAIHFVGCQLLVTPNVHYGWVIISCEETLDDVASEAAAEGYEVSLCPKCIPRQKILDAGCGTC